MLRESSRVSKQIAKDFRHDFIWTLRMPSPVFPQTGQTGSCTYICFQPVRRSVKVSRFQNWFSLLLAFSQFEARLFAHKNSFLINAWREKNGGNKTVSEHLYYQNIKIIMFNCHVLNIVNRKQRSLCPIGMC